MPNLKARRGIASEHQVVGQLLDAGIDVYRTVVDDQGIDGVLRVETFNGAIRYFDLQIKSARSWGDIRGQISALGARENTVLILFNSSTHECLWFDSEGIAQHFPGTGLSWGDVFLKSTQVIAMTAEGRGDLGALLERLQSLEE